MLLLYLHKNAFCIVHLPFHLLCGTVLMKKGKSRSDLGGLIYLATNLYHASTIEYDNACHNTTILITKKKM